MRELRQFWRRRGRMYGKRCDEQKQEAPARAPEEASVPEEIRRGKGGWTDLSKGRESASFVDTADIILV